MVSRRGHTLVELLITLTFLAATVGTVAGGTLAASRWARESTARQAARAVAHAVLDSLQASIAVADGEGEAGRWHLVWRAEPAESGRRVRVIATSGGLADSVVVEGVWAPPLPVFGEER